jgi:hypothetical protein
MSRGSGDALAHEQCFEFTIHEKKDLGSISYPFEATKKSGVAKESNTLGPRESERLLCDQT